MRLIDADALSKAFGDRVDVINENMRKVTTLPNIAWFSAMASAENIVEAQPTVDAEPVRHGYWIRKEWAEESEGLLIDNYECSACKSWVRNETNYCPNCGAKMDVERKEK